LRRQLKRRGVEAERNISGLTGISN
jgi:hypothetical protein